MSKLVKRLITLLFGDPFILRAYQRADLERTLVREGQGIKLLDVGAGDMGLTCWLKRRHSDWRVVACDVSSSPEAHKAAVAAGVEFHLTNGEWLPAIAGGYDTVLLSSVLQMVPEPAQLLNLCRGVLDPATGRVVLTVPAEYHFLSHWCESKRAGAGILRKLFKLPGSASQLHTELKWRFGVHGPRSYYATEEIIALLQAAGFRVELLQRTPGWLGTLAWETSLMLSLRGGSKMYALMGLVYPLVWLSKLGSGPVQVGEHLVTAAIER
jgi:2-polyprenyl-3-methyl-5-hydroxy-6-metoxy-1,4-benzoquinol methylase